jgi:hypothetical protein
MTGSSSAAEASFRMASERALGREFSGANDFDFNFG